MISSSGSPWFQSSPISALESASTEATDRSISAATITSVERQRHQRDLGEVERPGRERVAR